MLTCVGLLSEPDQPCSSIQPLDLGFNFDYFLTLWTGAQCGAHICSDAQDQYSQAQLFHAILIGLRGTFGPRGSILTLNSYHSNENKNQRDFIVHGVRA